MTIDRGSPGAASVPSPAAGARELSLRIASGLVLMVAALSTTLIGGWAHALVWLLAGFMVFWEWQRLVGGPRQAGRHAIGAAALTLCAVLAGSGAAAGAGLSLLVGAALLGAVAAGGRRLLAAAGLVYAGALVFSVCLLRRSTPDGLSIMLWLFAVVWGTDVMAFVGGRLIGGPKLAPRLSPSKTWAGFVVGIVSGSLLGLTVVGARGCLPCGLAMGLLVGVVAQGGDLFESALKRRFGVKDAGRLIPGHGGAMDRLDGFIAAASFAACIGLWRFGADAAGAGLLTW